jgi:serine/threonine protein kinase
VSDARLRMKYTLDIIAGMQHLHSKDHRVVHFDLTPANILLTLDGCSVKIIDFDASLTVETLRAADVSIARGTLRFMAPELLREVKEPSAACDVYSFAVVLAELWTGTPAWKIQDPDTGVWNDMKHGWIIGRMFVSRRPFTIVQLETKGVPKPIIALIVACWAQDPHQRPTFAQLRRLRRIPNFHEAAQKDWPSFLRGNANFSELGPAG